MRPQLLPFRAHRAGRDESGLLRFATDVRCPFSCRVYRQAHSDLDFSGELTQKAKRRPMGAISANQSSVRANGVLQDVYQLATLAEPKLDLAVSGGEQGVVATLLDVESRVDLAAALANDDRARSNYATVKDLHTEALGL